MFEEYCVPYFEKRSGFCIHSAMVKMIGIGESAAADRLSDLLEESRNPTVAPYAKQTQVHLRVTARAANEDACKELIAPVLAEIESRLGEYIYTTEEEKEIEDVVYELLMKNKLTITTAESLTGGLLAGRIINVSGASNVYKEGFITYSNEAKMKYLGVSEETLKVFGPVSSECAEEMARGAQAATGADVAVVTTGLAGPDGGTAEKPVGLVYVGVYYQGNVTVKELRLIRDRQTIRDGAVIRALNLVREVLLKS